MTEPKSDKPLRPDLQQVLESRAAILDDARPKAVAQQRKRGRWTAREGIAALVDRDSFVEYGGLARPAVSGMTGAADGVVMGTAQIDGRPVDLLIYDYTVYAGTQSAINHMKTTRMFEHAERHRLPVVCWLDGGGARPHDMKVEGRGSTPTFVVFARLSGLVPTIGILPGRAFAGHANLAGLCDVLIATKESTLGMAGPPLGEAADGAVLRDVVPDNPRRAYNVRKVIDGIADLGSVLELKAGFGRAVITSLIRIAGRPVGVVANQPMFLAGAIDSPASDKAAHFI